jgi:sulfatase maturation enzyme AslB (radical SAM superfamily)
MEKYRQNMEKIIRITRAMDIPIIKFSGGEIFLIEGLTDILMKAVGFERIQILTNATLLNYNIIKSLSKIKNLCIQITLDGHTYDMNKYRFSSEGTLSNVLSNVNLLLEYNIPLEINMCLTNNNIEGLKEFLEYLLNFNAKHLTLYPIPVREKETKYSVTMQQLRYLDEIIQDYSKYKKILPPLEYLIHMYQLLSNKRKRDKWICWVPQFVMGVQGNGEIKACPEVSTESSTLVGSLFQDSSTEIGKFERESLPLLLKTKCRVVPMCQGCYTHYEVINLYMNKYISDEELTEIYFFNNKRIHDFISTRKEAEVNE